MPTRREEYWLAYSAARTLPSASVVLDAGCGPTPHQHVLPAILASMGHGVIAVDRDAPKEGMQPHPAILRGVGDFTQTTFPDSSFDMVCCISVLEHIEPEERLAFAQEAHRALRKGGLLVVTMDECPPQEVVGMFQGFDFGPLEPEPPKHLYPRVAFAVGKKL